MRIFIICFLLQCIIALPFNAFTQYSNFSKEIKFANYLSERQMNIEAIYILNNIDTSELSQNQKDSLNYYYGQLFFNQKNLLKSASYYNKISSNSLWYTKSKLYASYDYAFENLPLNAIATLDNITANPTDSLLTELIIFEKASNKLLVKDFKGYDSLRKNFTYKSYALTVPENKMDIYFKKEIKIKYKSPFVAGVLSAIIPGLGKFYAGKKKQGVGSFLPIISMGILAAESYNKGGIKSANFIGFASLFSLFYVGNIWGSVVSVRVVNNERNRFYTNEILFNMQLPIRNLYR